MEGYEKHEWPAYLLPKKIMGGRSLDVEEPDLLRANTTSEPAPGVPDYSIRSRAVAVVKNVDEIRAKAEDWEADNPTPTETP
jgi:hypothetical protein